MHYLISRSYVADERFRQYYESQQEGLAQWLADAIASNAAAYGVDLTNLEWG
ncbi:MAG: TipAS antibiotic-recognition domain-containing protein [Lawsonella clevelandensis]